MSEKRWPFEYTTKFAKTYPLFVYCFLMLENVGHISFLQSVKYALKATEQKQIEVAETSWLHKTGILTADL